LCRAQFGLTTLFVVVTLISIPLAIRASRERAYRARLAAIVLLRGEPTCEIKVDAKNPRMPRSTVRLVQREPAIEPDDIVLEVEIGQYGAAPLSDELVAAILAVSTLRRLTIRDCAITTAQLAEIGKLLSLESLDLTGSDVGDEGIRQLGRLRSLRRLRLYDTKVTDAGLACLVPLGKLKALELTKTKITDAGLRHLAPLRSLQDLGLSGTDVSDNGVGHLNALTSLRWLDLCETKITDAGLAFLYLPRLEGLYLDRNHIGDDGLAHIARMSYLYCLSVSETQVTDTGLKWLRRLDSLEDVSLRRCSLSDAGLPSLGKVRTLCKTFIEDTESVSAEGVERLKAIRPGLRAYWRRHR
jgi:hypothetical protein